MYDARVEDPGKFAKEFMLAKEMGWTWSAIAETPTPVIEEFYQRILAEHRMKAKREDIDKQIAAMKEKQ